MIRFNYKNRRFLAKAGPGGSLLVYARSSPLAGTVLRPVPRGLIDQFPRLENHLLPENVTPGLPTPFDGCAVNRARGASGEEFLIFLPLTRLENRVIRAHRLSGEPVSVSTGSSD